ncbi:glycosyltransferase family 2 protein [Palleronia sediminis]|uniref:Glycosyltransferase family 2 protein n=1 Tax=Palleronia sediminis TaxID=2547833 RepID=A0A4R6AJC8_9RHOB|nr:glycosyltransferase family A protein [Palleronia sediminis]TDL83617.1 glycosyltransferase family 2 protein [Palleronia sediminis]
MTTLTIAITAHSETIVSGPTFRSVRAALAGVEARGAEVQLLLGLDRCTEASHAFMTQAALDDFDRHAFDFGDQGKTRNALADLARGRFLAFVDADDLVSENWLTGALDLLERPENDRAIVHPELNWLFDGVNNVYASPAQDHPFFSPRVMPAANYYDAICVAPRAAWQDIRYADRDVARGYAFEDYQWFVEATAAGWRHLTARDTIVFKRRRDASQTHESRNNSVLIRTIEPLAIDRIADMAGDAGR